MIHRLKIISLYLAFFCLVLLTFTSCSLLGLSDDKDGLFLRGLHGSGMDLRKPQPTLTLVHFWSTWCAMCKHELLTLQNLERTLDRKKIRIVSVAIDSTQQNVLELMENYNLHLYILLDGQDKAKDFYRISDVPATILLDKNGKEIKFREPESGKFVKRTKGPQAWDRPDVINYFKNLQ